MPQPKDEESKLGHHPLPERCNSPSFPSVLRSTPRTNTEDTDANHFGDFCCTLFPLGQPDAWRAMIDKTAVGAFLEYSPNPTWLADSDGRCVYANQALRDISAISTDQLGDLNWLELVTDEDRDMSSTLGQEARVHNQPYLAHLFLRGENTAHCSLVDAVGA